MKKLITLLVIAISLMTTVLHAQSSEIEWGPVMKVKKRICPSEFLGSSNDEVYALCVKPRILYLVFTYFLLDPAYYIKVYDKGTLEENLQFDLFTPKMFKGAKNENGKKRDFDRMDFVDVTYLNGKFYLFYSELNEREKTETLYGKIFDSSGGQEEEVELSKFSYKNKGKNGKFEVMFPSDSSAFMVLDNQPGKKGKYEYNVSYFDLDMQKQYKQSFELETEGSISIQDIEVDNNAIAYIYVKNLGKKKKKESAANYKLMTLDLSEGSLNEFGVALDGQDLKLGNANLILNPVDTTCKMVGYYYGKKWAKGAEGAFFMEVDGNSGEEINNNTEEFPPNSSGTTLVDRKGKPVDNPNSDVLIRKILYDNEGNTYMLGEDWNEITYCDRRGNCYTITYYLNIHITKFNPSGGIEWHSIIPKNQTAYGAYSSYSAFMATENLVIIFNDNPKNLAKKKGKVDPVIYKKADLIGAKVNLETGAVKKTQLYSGTKDRTFKKNMVAAGAVTRLNSKEAVMIAVKGFSGKYRLGTLKLNGRW